MASDTYQSPNIPSAQTVDPSLVTYTHLIYGLHAFSVAAGLLSTATTVIGGFIFGLPSIIAVIMNYARRSEVRGTWLESHFRWQINTFWSAALLGLLLIAVSLPLVIVFGLGIAIWYVGALLLSVWIIYRVARGWIALRDRRQMYTGSP